MLSKPHPARDGGLDPEAAAARAETLFQEHARLVLGICRSMLRDPEEAEDASQQTFLSAYRALLTGTVPREEEPWLATIARNECRRRIGLRMRAGIAVGDIELLAGEAAPAETRLDVAALRAAIAALPDMQRRAILLREFHGLSYDEVAGALQTTAPAVESLLVRARRTLQGRLRTAAAAAYGFGPFVFLRDLFARGAAVAGGLPSLPESAKVAAGVAAVTLAAGGTAVAIEATGPDGPAPARAQTPQPVVANPVRPVVRDEVSAVQTAASARVVAARAPKVTRQPAPLPTSARSAVPSPAPGGGAGEGSASSRARPPSSDAPTPPPAAPTGPAPQAPTAGSQPAAPTAQPTVAAADDDDDEDGGDGGDDDAESSGPGGDDDDDGDDDRDSSGPGSGGDDDDDSSGPGSGDEDDDDEDSSGSGSSGSGSSGSGSGSSGSGSDGGDDRDDEEDD